jgi:hypothetical protein
MFSWFHKKNISSYASKLSRKDFIKSLIVHKQIKEFSSYLRQKDDRTLCIEAFFELLPLILEEKYTPDLVELITKKSGLKSNQLSTIITNQISSSILKKDFDLCEKILHLPFQSLKISLPTYEIIQLIHTCSNTQQLFQCLSILIEKNLPYDSEYLSWILIILFEHYQIGDEIIIEYILNINKHINLLFKCYGNNNVTPLMLFLHLYSNNKCQVLIDYYLSNIKDQSILFQCDKWNRSYLMHLLCGQCQHESQGNSFEILSDDIEEMKKQLMNQCPHASAVLSKFSMLYKLKNKCDKPVKTILISQYCLPLRIILLNYLLENDTLNELRFDEFFQYFPSKFIPIYINYLKKLIQNQNLNSFLVSLLRNPTNDDDAITFLLRQGARIDDMSIVNNTILNLILYSRSMIPFTLLDYGLYTDVSYATWFGHQTLRMNFYICRAIQCGYPSELRAKFDELKTHLPQQAMNLIDLKNPPCLSKLCLQKLRSSLKNLGDETIDKLKDDLPNYLRQSITLCGHDESQAYFQIVVLSP